jgi:hypothetical protein
MKRLLVICVGLASLFSLATAQADTSLGASTTGVNHTFAGIRDQHSSFTVKDFGPDAGPAEVDTGNISFHDITNGFNYNADVTCVMVFNGNQAKFAHQIPPGNPDAGQWILYAVKDGGEPGTNGDELSTFFTGFSEAFACSLVNTPTFPASPNQTITGGNIQVR